MSSDGIDYMGSCHPHGRLIGVPGSWLNPSCCGNLGSKSEDGMSSPLPFSLPPLPPPSLSAFLHSPKAPCKLFGDTLVSVLDAPSLLLRMQPPGPRGVKGRGGGATESWSGEECAVGQVRVLAARCLLSYRQALLLGGVGVCFPVSS